MDKLVFLGFMISEFGVSPASTLIQAIKDLRAPTNFSGDRSIIGLISYPRKCVDHISINIEPLIRLTLGLNYFMIGLKFKHILKLLTNQSFQSCL
jgi:hypothetical protein